MQICDVVNRSSLDRLFAWVEGKSQLPMTSRDSRAGASNPYDEPTLGSDLGVAWVGGQQ